MAIPAINQNVTLDYEAMTMVQLNDEFVRLAGVLAVCQNQRNEIQTLYERRRRAAAAQQRVSALSKAEKDALRAALGGGE